MGTSLPSLLESRTIMNEEQAAVLDDREQRLRQKAALGGKARLHSHSLCHLRQTF